MNTLTLNQPVVKTFTGISASHPLGVMTIKAFPKGKQWFIEVVFKGDTKTIVPATQGEITQIALDLDERGWQIDPSLFHRGFNAKPAHELGRWWTVRGDALAIAEDEPLGYSEDDELIFVSGIEWTEAEYGLESYV